MNSLLPDYAKLDDETTCGADEARRRYRLAKAAVDALINKRDESTSNNPNKFNSQIKDAQRLRDRWHYTLTYIYKVDPNAKDPTGDS